VKVWALHLALICCLAFALAVLPPYPATTLARIMVLAVFAMGYNLAFGYTGLLSLGHALFLAAGVFAAGLSAQFWGCRRSGAVAWLIGRRGRCCCRWSSGAAHGGVSFMIVTLMFAQAGYLTVLYFGTVTGGDEGFNLQRCQPDAAWL
jgi:branched-chain amino acid transport system permease protein